MLSMKAKYGLRAALYMAGQALAGEGETFLQARTIAEKADVPLRFLEAILLELRRKGLIVTRRGAWGGYRLARPPQEITTGQIIRTLDGMVAPLPCASVYKYQPCEDCIDPATCQIRHLMLEVRNEIANVLDHRTLHDILTQPPKFEGDKAHANTP
ncbi:MAG: Rrf2 family transcriptional regulator [Alphaproteobacteria bacterium]|nr:Rrf2 family transcriptional regulator [Alphaproteobacteria bacterium]